MRNYTINPKTFSKKRSKNKKFSFKKTLKILAILAGWFLVFAFWYFQIKIKWDLPDITQIKDMTFSQATIITDRNDKVLYKLFAENREYVPYSGINENMINAIVSAEDQRYREHNWLDTMWIFRAIISKALNPWSRMQWASTIPQQLVRNLLLTNDRKIERKLKEMVLAKKLDSVIEDEVKDTMWKLSTEELDNAKRERILELYLNYIFLWNNSYWVEAASKTYFGVSANDLDVLQSAILASIPKWPTSYNPYNNRTKLMWKLTISDSSKNEYPFASWWLHDEVLSKIKSNLSKADFSNKKDYNSFSKYIQWLLEFTITYDWDRYSISYSPWRKDFVLSRMFEDDYIGQDQLIKAFIDWLDLKFENNGFPIEAPHFVMRVTELLEEKFDEEVLMNDWLVVKTTLDLDIQDIAEKSLKNNIDSLDMYWATNEAMIYVDTINWDVLSYVWSIDYFNDEIWWQNDMIRSARQIGSTMKPLIYSKAFADLPITLDTPIYDIPFQIWPDRPNNADWKFMWLLPLRQALAYSRNIPAAKVITAIWWQDLVLPYLRSLWLTSLDENWDYWYPLAFWAWEVPMFELANAYSHLSTSEPWVIDPILEIKTNDWSILYQKEEQKQEKVIPDWIVYLLRNILSDFNNMPSSRAWAYSVRWLLFGLKSWTSNMKTPKWDRARDWWLVTYTPSKVALFRWGNADGSPMYQNAYGWFLNASAMREFRSTLLANNYISNEWMSAVDVAEVNISKISWKLAWDNTPWEFITKTLAYVESQPTTYDPWMTQLEFDASCNWLSSPYTPSQDLKRWYIIQPTSFMPSNMDLNEITAWRQWSTNSWLMKDFDASLSGRITFNYDNILLAMPQDYCQDRSPQISQDIHIDIKNLKDWQKISTKPMIRFNVKWENPIKRVSVSINWRVIWSVDYKLESNDITDVIISNLWEEIWDGELSLLAIDSAWFSNRKSINVSLVSTDTTPPFILKDNTFVEQVEDKYRVIVFLNDDLSSVDWWTIKQNWTAIKNFTKNIAEFKIETPWILEVYAKDWFGNELTESIDITKYIYWYVKEEKELDDLVDEVDSTTSDVWSWENM